MQLLIRTASALQGIRERLKMAFEKKMEGGGIRKGLKMELLKMDGGGIRKDGRWN